MSGPVARGLIEIPTLGHAQGRLSSRKDRARNGAPEPLLKSSHEAQVRAGGTDAAGLWEFAAAAVGFWSSDSGRIVAPATGRGLGEFDLFHRKSLKIWEVERRLLDGWLSERAFCERRLANRGVPDCGLATGLVRGHQDVNVLEDAARSDAEDAVGGFDEIVSFAAGMLAAEVVDEAETGSELFGLHQETRAVRLPFLFHVALPRVHCYLRYAG